MKPSFMDRKEGKTDLKLTHISLWVKGLKQGILVLLILSPDKELQVGPTDEPSFISVLIQSFFLNNQVVQIPSI